jgi:lysyl-tRNA synthetase class 2
MILDLLRDRALFKKQVRSLMEDNGLIEIDVPLLYPHVCPDRHVEPISLVLGGKKLYLQPSPELNLKKILAKQPLDCYSLNYAYRADPPTDQHHPEFMMLEFYLMGDRYQDVKRLTIDTIELLCGKKTVRTRTYKQAWLDVMGGGYTRSYESFASLLGHFDIAFESQWNLDTLEDLLFGLIIQPTLGQECIDIIDGFPLHQAALAIVEGNDTARRFEVFLDGIEIANGYDELADRAANTERFYEWQEQRHRDGLDVCDPVDISFLEAMDTFPRCAGVALGMDRIMMRALECTSLLKTIPFYWHDNI